MTRPHIVDIILPVVVLVVGFFFVIYLVSGSVLVAAVAGGIASPIGGLIGSEYPLVGTAA